MISENDKVILRELAAKYAEYASLPEQKERRNRWLRHNALESERPLVLIDQLPWTELNIGGCLDRKVQDDFFASVEMQLRYTIFAWEHFPADMVLDPYIKVPHPMNNTGWGLESSVSRLKQKQNSDVYAQHIINQIEEPEDIEKIHTPVITVDEAYVKEISEACDMIFGGIIPWQFSGMIMHLGAWDTIAYWMGVENCYIELMDRPEMMHVLMEKLTQGYLGMIEQFNALKLFDTCGHICHCSHTYRYDDNPDGEGLSGNTWAFGLAQLFTGVSPKITEEFECAYMKRIFPHFKNIYYGCCDRLDDRMELVAALPNVRKLSCSPWSHREAFAEKLPASIIMSNKPTPALLSPDRFNEDAVRADLRRTMDAAKRYGKSLELILKDVSTVRYQPERLTRWSQIALEEASR